MKCVATLGFEIFSNCCFFSCFLFFCCYFSFSYYVKVVVWFYLCLLGLLLPFIQDKLTLICKIDPNKLLLMECSFFLMTSWGFHINFSELLAVWQQYVLFGLQFIYQLYNIWAWSLNEIFMKVPPHANDVTHYDIIIYVRVYRSINFSRIVLYIRQV